MSYHGFRGRGVHRWRIRGRGLFVDEHGVVQRPVRPAKRLSPSGIWLLVGTVLALLAILL